MGEVVFANKCCQDAYQAGYEAGREIADSVAEDIAAVRELLEERQAMDNRIGWRTFAAAMCGVAAHGGGMPDINCIRDFANAMLAAETETFGKGEDDDADFPERWLYYAMLTFCAELPCEASEDSCKDSGDCITEWCLPCAARAMLDKERETLTNSGEEVA